MPDKDMQEVAQGRSFSFRAFTFEDFEQKFAGYLFVKTDMPERNKKFRDNFICYSVMLLGMVKA